MLELLEKANSLYFRLPIYMQYAIDEEEDSGLEPEELPDGYERLEINNASIFRQ